MYVGNNATAIRSQKWIVDSLLSLMEQKSYAEITVRDICKSADLSRQTFYNVFDSKDEVLCFRLRNEYQRQFARFCVKEDCNGLSCRPFHGWNGHAERAKDKYRIYRFGAVGICKPIKK